jgi:hypothetical protein
MNAITHRPPVLAARTEADTTVTVAGAPDQVFPLLCPVREHDWIPDWRCTMVHSSSGVAEQGCVFTRDGAETWITTTYEPPARIEYTTFVHDLGVRTLRLDLAPTPDGSATTMRVRATSTATGPAGLVGRLVWTAEDHRRLWDLRAAQLNHHLTTGTALPPES